MTLFSIATGNLGVTYDPNNNSLWIATNDGTGVIADYSLAGALLSSFLTGVPSITALAFDPADGTLWFSNGETNLSPSIRLRGRFSKAERRLGCQRTITGRASLRKRFPNPRPCYSSAPAFLASA